MKVALIVLRWAGLAASIVALVLDLTILASMACITLPLSVFAIIVNALSIAKHAKQRRSIGAGVLQCITLTGIPAGAMMIVGTCFEKKLAPVEEDAEEVVEEVVEEVIEVVEE